MALNDTPAANRVHIAFFGKRNAGKSSLLNAITNQEVSIVSDVKGTTTDPVQKTMELLPIGPVMLIDTPGLDDEGILGELRIKKARRILNKTDIAVIVIDSSEQVSPESLEIELLNIISEKNIPYLIVYNKCEFLSEAQISSASLRTINNHKILPENQIYVSALTGYGINDLKNRLGTISKKSFVQRPIVNDLIKPGEIVVMVTPIDNAAPKGRLILPQQLVLRDIIDSDAIAIVVKENNLESALSNLSTPPSLVITDSQVFDISDRLTPKNIPLTSFSIVMARFKGYLETAVKGINAIDSLKDGDKILISEGCTHHRQCGDIGSIKIPAWLNKYTGKTFDIHTTSGIDFPEDISKYSLIIHCGGCMLNEREVLYRMKCANDAGIPFTNYGIAIAKMKGILKRSIEIFNL